MLSTIVTFYYNMYLHTTKHIHKQLDKLVNIIYDCKF